MKELLLHKLQMAGLTKRDALAVIGGNELATEVVDFIQQRKYKIFPDQKRARQIMGFNFLGINEVARNFGVDFHEQQLALLETVGFPENLLYACRHSHALFPGYPLSILDIRDRVAEELFHPCVEWCNNEPFARDEKVDPRWYLIRTDIIPGSFGKDYENQAMTLGNNEEVPWAREIVFMIILYYLVRKIRLFENIYVRCQDVDSHNFRVRLGYFNHAGLRLRSHWDGYGYSYIGIAPAWKPYLLNF